MVWAYNNHRHASYSSEANCLKFYTVIKSPKIFHLLTQDMIKAFKSRAQAIFSSLEKTPPWFTKFKFE
jgi:hypothetical protein